jgi:drug/metabolite transporter (DMT)-like permease
MATSPDTAPVGARKHIGLLLITGAASMWALDTYFRGSLTNHLTPTQIVLGEDLIASLVLLTVTVRNWRHIRALTKGEWTATAAIAVLAQALGTVLFTLSFAHGLYQETIVLQQTQPLIAVALAMAALGERPKFVYWPLLVIAVVAVYLVSFGPDASVPFRAISNGRFIVGVEAFGAAVCWASGTVLGRLVTTSLTPASIAALRFQLALPILFLFTFVPPRSQEMGGGLTGFRFGDLVPLIAIAMIPGVISLAIYYRGLRSTPASMATIGELAYPIAASFIATLPPPGGFGQPISAPQIFGTVMLLFSVVALSLSSNRTISLVGRPHSWKTVSANAWPKPSVAKDPR